MSVSNIANTDDSAFDGLTPINLEARSMRCARVQKKICTGGPIINFSTRLVGSRLPTYGVYAATKAGVEVMTSILAK